MQNKRCRVMTVIVSLWTVFAFGQNSYNYIGDGGEGKSIAFNPPLIEGTAGYVGDSFLRDFRYSLESLWKEYSAISVVATDKLAAMIKVQQKSQDVRHSDKTAIESGGFLAEYYTADVSVAVTRSGQMNATIRIYDNTNGKVTAVYKTPQYESENAFLEGGRAAKNIALHTLPALGVHLSQAATMSLSDYSGEDDTLLSYRNREKALTLSIEEIQQQIDASDDQTTTEILRAKQKSLEEERKEEQRRIARAEEAERLLAEDKKKMQQRSKELKKLIEKNSAVFNTMAKTKRAALKKNQSPTERIATCEMRKRTLIGIKDNTFSKIIVQQEKENADFEADKQKIENQPYSITEKDAKGKPTKEAKAKRKAQIQAVKEASEARKAKYAQTQFDVSAPEYENVRAKVNTSINEMQNLTENSLVNKDLLHFGNYDGEKRAWEAYVHFIVSNQEIANEKIWLSYEAVTGVKKGTKENAHEYNNNVDAYSSYFSTKVPVVYVEVNYNIQPRGGRHYSEYTVNLVSYTFKRIDSDMPIYQCKAAVPKKTVSLMPAAEVDYLKPLSVNELTGKADRYFAEQEKQKKREEKRAAKQKAYASSSSVKPSYVAGGASASDFFSMGYMPLGVAVGVSVSRAEQTVSFQGAINTAYLFYIPYLELGPEIQVSATLHQFNFRTGLRLQKNFTVADTVNLYIAGGMGLDLFTVNKHAAFFGGLEFGYYLFDSFTLNVKLDGSTQPMINATFGCTYFFK